jgi:hypothetical protein
MTESRSGQGVSFLRSFGLDQNRHRSASIEERESIATKPAADLSGPEGN